MILAVNIRGGDVRTGVMEEIRRRINKIKRERWGQSKIRSWRRAIVMCGVSRGDCHSVSGAYIDFYIRCWRSGQSDCEGGAGSWETAVCMHNVVMRFARAGESSRFYDVL